MGVEDKIKFIKKRRGRTKSIFEPWKFLKFKLILILNKKKRLSYTFKTASLNVIYNNFLIEFTSVIFNISFFL